MQFIFGASARATLTGMVGAMALGALTLSPGALARTAGTDQPVTPLHDAASPVQQAEAQLSEGRLIAAQSTLSSAVRSASLDASQRDDAIELLGRVERRIKTTDVNEISLQKAELGVQTGDLFTAERHARAVLRQTKITPEQQKRADLVLADIDTRRAELAPLVPAMITQAQADFAAKRYAEAKTAINTVYRSGVELSPEQRRVIDGVQVQIHDLERAAGKPFATDANLGVMQPGTVRRRQPATPATAPAPQPEPLPTPPAPPAAPAQPTEPAAPQPAPEPVPTYTAQPEPTPVTTHQPGSGSYYIPPDGSTTTTTTTTTTEPTTITYVTPSQPADSVVADAMRAEAQAKIAEGDLAFKDKRFADAARLYESALVNRAYLSSADADRAQQRLNESRALLGIPTNTPQGLAGEVLTTERVARERAQAEFDNNMSQAQDALKAGETGRAMELQLAAKTTADRAKDYFSQAENDAFAKRLTTLKAQIEAADEVKQASEAKAREQSLKAEAAAKEKALRKEKEERIVSAINRVRALQKEQKYAEALEVLDQVLFMDPGQPTALLLRDVISDYMNVIMYTNYQKRKIQGIIKEEIENADAGVPPKGIMSYPQDWPSKTMDRVDGTGYTETPENMRAIAALEGRKIPVQFKGNRLADVLAYVQTNTNTSFDVNWDSLAAIGITPEAPVNLSFKDTRADIVLARVLNQVSRDRYAKADYTVADGIVTIASADDIQRQTATSLYPISDLLLVVPDYDKVPPLDLANVLAAAKQRGDRTPFTPKLDTETERLGETRNDRLRKIIETIQMTVDPDSWRDNGGDVGTVSEINGSLFITTTPRNHREIAGLLSKLRDIRSMQINFETRFLLVNQAWFEQIGFSLDVVFNTDSNMVTAAQAVDPSVLPSDFFDFTQSPPLLRNITGAQTLTGATPPSTDVTGQGTVPPNRWSPIGAGQNSLGLAQLIAPPTAFASQILGAAPALGIAGRFLDDIQVDFVVKATQADRRNLSLTAPRLTLTNGQTANVYVTTQRTFISDLTPIVGDSAVGFDPDTGVVPEGATLLVEGVISADRRYVTVNIETGVSRIDRIRQVPVTAVAGGELVNSATAASFIELPESTVTNVQTTVTVPDEGTVLLGGQRLVNEFQVETGVPILSKIPIINRFFSNRIESREEQTLLILLKPTILIQSEQEEKAFPGLEDRVRSGAR